MISSPSRSRRRIRPILLLTLLTALAAQTVGLAAGPTSSVRAPESVFERDADHVRVIIWNGVTDSFLTQLRTVTDYDIVYRYASLDGVALRIPVADQARVLAFSKAKKLSAEAEVFYKADMNAATRTTFVKGSGSGGSGEAWDLSNGAGVSIAIIDSGIYRDHPSLNDQDLTGGGAKIVGFRDYVNGGAVVPAYDDNGHGSHVAGIAAGTGQGSSGTGPSGRGHVGVAYGANLFGLKVLDSEGTASSTDTVAAIDWMTQNGHTVNPPIRVANYSIGPIVQTPGSNNGSSANAQAMNRAVQAGINFIQSGGNGDSDGLLPNQQDGNVGGDARYSIAVCSSNSAAPPTAPTYSTWDSEGPTADGRPKPEVCAPGDGINSADWDSPGYVNQGGTSMSSPHVAGVAALIVAAVPSITPAQVKKVIIQTAREYAGTAAYDEFAPHNGWNGARGWGEVNAKAAIQRAIAEYGGNNPLTLSTGGPYTVIQGESRSLLASASFGRPPYAFSWDLNNDGTFETTGAGATFTDTAAAGTRAIRVKVTDSATTPATVTASTIVDVLASTTIFNDAVTGTNGWVSDDPTGWHVTNIHANSPTQSWYAGNDVVEQYPPLADFSLSRTFDLTTAQAASASQLVFKFARGGALEEGFDSMTMDIKKTSDATWTTLATWDDDLGDSWNIESFDITAFRGFSTDIRFHLVADELFEFRGPFLDDFKILGAVPSTDTVAPDPVALSAGSPTTQSVMLSWNATGDDGSTGLAATYDVRYAATPLNAGNFALAPQASGVPSPASPGTAQSMVVSGLNPNTTYYFAMKVGDESSNYSPISNVASALTLPDTTPPSGVTLSGAAGDGQVQLSWTPATDNVAVDEYEVLQDGSVAATVAHPTLARTITGLTNGTTYQFTVRAKDTAGNTGPSSNALGLTPFATPQIEGWLQAGGNPAKTGYTAGSGSIAVPNVLQTLTTGETVTAPPVVADLNGDGLMDVVIVTDMVTPQGDVVVRAFRQTATGLVPYWTSVVPEAPALGQPATNGLGRIAAGDLDGDGTVEIVVASNYETDAQAGSLNDGSIRVLKGSDGTLRGAAVATTIGLPSNLAVGDVDGNAATQEVAFTHQVGGTASGYYLGVLGFDGTGASMMMDVLIGANSLLASPAIANLRPSAGNEIVVAESAGTQRVLICSLATQCGESIGAGQSVRGLSIADLDGDLTPEIIVNSTTGQSLKVLKTSPLAAIGRADSYLWNTAAAANVAGDSKNEIVNVNYSEFVDDTAKAGNVAVRSFDGSAIGVVGNLTRTPAPGSSTQSKGGASLVNIAGDARPEMVFADGTGDLVAIRFAANGTPSQLWSLDLPSAATTQVAAGDVTGDGLLDLITATSGGQIVIVGAGKLAGITISPTSSTVVAGGSQTYSVEGFDAAGNSLGDVTGSTGFAITGGTCTGSSCTSTVAGDHIVTATKDGKTAAATLTVTPGPLDTLTIDPATSSVAAGQAQAYTVTGSDQYGNSLGNVTPSTGFSIAPNGSCSGNACSATVSGPHTVTATNGTVTTTASLQVNPGPLASLVLSPSATTVVLGNSQAYTAQGRDSFGNSLGDLTAGTTFAIFPDGTCTGATCSPASIGDHTVRAARGTAQGSALMHVIPESIYRVVVSPSSATIAAGGAQAFTAEGFDGNNQSIGDVTANTVFTIGPNGTCSGNVCTATIAGPHTVRGAVAQTSATAQLNVTAGPQTGIKVTPAVSQIPSGGSRTYTVLGTDQYGNATGDVTASAAFAIAPDGSCTGNVCTASVYGDHTVTATAAPYTANATLKVVPQSPSITTPAAGSVNGPSIDVTGTAPLGTTVTLWDNGIKIADNVPVGGDGSWSVTRSFTNGNHSMTAFASAGDLMSAPSAARLFSVDGSAPTATIYRRGGYLVAQAYHPFEPVVVDGIARDANSGVAAVEVTYEGIETVVDTVTCTGACSEFRWSSSPDLLPGVYSVSAVAIDRAGNRGSAASITIVTTSLVGGGGGGASAPAAWIRPNVVE